MNKNKIFELLLITSFVLFISPLWAMTYEECAELISNNLESLHSIGHEIIASDAWGHMNLDTAYARYGEFPVNIEFMHQGHSVSPISTGSFYNSDLQPLLFIRNMHNKPFVLSQLGSLGELHCVVLNPGSKNYLEVCCPYVSERPAVEYLLFQRVEVPFFEYNGHKAYMSVPRKGF